MGRICADCAAKLSHGATEYHEPAADANAAEWADDWEEAGAGVVERHMNQRSRYDRQGVWGPGLHDLIGSSTALALEVNSVSSSLRCTILHLNMCLNLDSPKQLLENERIRAVSWMYTHSLKQTES